MKSLYHRCHVLWLLLVVLLPKMVFSQFGEKLGDEWEQVSPNIEFQRSADWNDEDGGGAMNEAMNRMLGGQSYANSPYSYSFQSTGKEWNSYQLAWRLLGFYIDCNYKGDNSYCQRLVLYAVYVDPDYSGGGLSEYEFYDASSGEFKCYNYYGNCRAKMDCHLSNTDWQLMGIFKIASISAGNGWMEQLFKHEGVCVWGEDTYKFASKMREKIPSGCSKSKYTTKQGNYLYYDAKPGSNAKIGVGLYTDSKCSIEYGGTDVSVYTVTGYSEDYFDTFNEALDTWKICQPCVAYNLNYAYSNFYCYDEAGYENCNQCMKFSAKSYCETASARDISLAERQETLVSFRMYGSNLGAGSYTTSTNSIIRKASPVDTTSYEQSFPFMTCSMLFFMFSLIMFGLVGPWKFAVLKRRRRKNKRRLDNDDDNNDGLVRDNGAVELPAIIASISRSFSKGSEAGSAKDAMAAELGYRSENPTESSTHNNDEALIDFQLYNEDARNDVPSNKMGQKLAGIFATISNSFSSKDNMEERSVGSSNYAPEVAAAFGTSQEKKQPLLHDADVENAPLQFDRGLAGTYGLEPPVYQFASTATSLPATDSEWVPQETFAYESAVIQSTQEIKQAVDEGEAPSERMQPNDPPGAELEAHYASTDPEGEQLFSSSQSVSAPRDEPLETNDSPLADPIDPPNADEAAGFSDTNSLDDMLDGESLRSDDDEPKTSSIESSIVDDQRASIVVDDEEPSAIDEQKFDDKAPDVADDIEPPVVDNEEPPVVAETRPIAHEEGQAIDETELPMEDDLTSVASSNRNISLNDDEEAETLSNGDVLPGVDSEGSMSSTPGIDRYDSLESEVAEIPPLTDNGIRGMEDEVVVGDSKVSQSYTEGPERYASVDNVTDDIVPQVNEDVDDKDKTLPNAEAISEFAFAEKELEEAPPSLPDDALDDGFRLEGYVSGMTPHPTGHSERAGSPSGSDTYTFGSENCVAGDDDRVNSNAPISARDMETGTPEEKDEDGFSLDAPFDEGSEGFLGDPISMDREAGSSCAASEDHDSDKDGEVVGSSVPSSPGTGAASIATGIDNFLLDNDHFVAEDNTPSEMIESISIPISQRNDQSNQLFDDSEIQNMDRLGAIVATFDTDDDRIPESLNAKKDPPISSDLLDDNDGRFFVDAQPPLQNENDRARLQFDEELSEANEEGLGDEETVSSFSSTEYQVDPSTLAAVSHFIDLVHQKSQDEQDLKIDEKPSGVPDDEVLDKLGLLDIKSQFSGGAGES